MRAVIFATLPSKNTEKLVFDLDYDIEVKALESWLKALLESKIAYQISYIDNN